MKIFICCSKAFYGHIPKIKASLEVQGHVVTLPNSYADPQREEKMRTKGAKDHARWKGKMLQEQARKVKANDAILVLNFKKNGQPDYIGGAVFLEMFKAYELKRKIYLYNSIPKGILHDEILGFAPVVLNGNLEKIG